MTELTIVQKKELNEFYIKEAEKELSRFEYRIVKNDYGFYDVISNSGDFVDRLDDELQAFYYAKGFTDGFDHSCSIS
jgi:hypothetical protein